MELIDKDYAVALIKKRKKDWQYGSSTEAKYKKEECDDILSLLNTLEVKKVNLDDDYIEEVYSHIDSIKDTADRMTSGNFMHHKAAIKFSANTIANVLELIGLKAQKGE